MQSYKFSWTLNSNPNDPTTIVTIAIANASGAILAGPQDITASQQTNWTFSLPEGIGYTSTVTSRDAAGVLGDTPSVVTFDVVAPPPPQKPGNPVQNPPVRV